MICFNCGCFGHVKANCVFKKKDVQPPRDAPANPVTDNANNVVPMTTETYPSSSDPMIESVKAKKDDGHGPWMLKSYKNKKRDSGANGTTRGQNLSSSRFSILENDDGGTVVTEADIIKTPINPKVPPPNDNEPRIVSLWKNLHKKLHDKGPDETLTKPMNSRSVLISPSPSTGRKDPPHPMKDITNDLSVDNVNRKIGNHPSKPRKTVAGSTMVKGSTSGVKSFSIFSSDIPPFKITTFGPPINNSSHVGH